MKIERPDPNLPRGVQAFLFDAAERRRKAEDSVVRRLQEAGLREVILPVLDFADPYAGVTAEGDERVYRFLDRQGNTLSLRADFTPMAARVIAPRLGTLSGPVSLFYRGDVVRDEETGVGRRREFAQVGAERYGDGRPEADGEMLVLALSCLGDIPAARLRLTLGWAGLLERLLVAVAPALAKGGSSGLGAAVAAARARHVTQLEALLRASGAAEAAAVQVARALLVGFDPGSELFRPPVLAGASAELARAAALARSARPGLPVVVDLADAPQAPYYTGLTFSVDAASGGGTIAGGGRYDGLLARFGTATPALGFCIGLETLGAGTEAGEEAARPLRIAVGKGRLLSKALEALH
ncbi:MAG: ATP phosphoribosyltransferase regulatory subunit, partial [Thermoanaerobaculia bacterium]